MTTILVIDDERMMQPREGVAIRHASNITQALDAIYSIADFTEIWLDHDLGTVTEDSEIPVTTMVVVDRLEQYAVLNMGAAPRLPTIYVHTQNPVGAQNIIRALDRYYTVKRVGVDAFLPQEKP